MAQVLPQLIPQAVEIDKKPLIILISGFVIFLLKFSFIAFPETQVLESFFPYDPQLMTKPAYVDYFSNCLTYIIMYLTMVYVLPPKHREYAKWLLFCWFMYFIDFYLRYNNPVTKFYLSPSIYIPIGISSFIGFFIVAMIGIETYQTLKKYLQK